MKNLLFLIIFLNAINLSVFCQSIPLGQSNDTVWISVDSVSNITSYKIFYYKPQGYSPATSPVLWYVHGQGGNGSNIYSLFMNYAERHNALIVGATMHTGWEYSWEGLFFEGCGYTHWSPLLFKQIYKHIKERENRDSIPIYLTGFSAGGQFVTRYMLIRQGVPDSIPIIHAASLSPYSYTFCTDTFQNVYMPYFCGLGEIIFNPICQPYYYSIFDKCNQNIIQYYNENYTVLVGILDTAGNNPGQSCVDSTGLNRLERARTFYAFSDSNAVNRGTTLKWQYAEIPGIGHDGTALYNYIAPGDTIPLVEKILFETPYHTVQSLAPIASFVADTTVVYLIPNATVHFTNNSINSDSYKWSFGDGDSSIAVNPGHTYLYADTFHVSLTAYSPPDCSNKLTKYKYIIVKNGTFTNEINRHSGNLQIFPNPSNGIITIQTLGEAIETIEIYNDIGIKKDEISFKNNSSICNYKAKDAVNGLYFLKVKTKDNVYIEKIMFK